jgi:quinol monooxygenase YgiN
MYGTIMRARLKPGMRAEYERLLREEVPSAEEYGNGMHCVELAFEEGDPDRLVAIVHFEDRESYLANAARPETEGAYRRQLDFFDGEPEWIDVAYGQYVGRPLTDTVGTA